MITRGNYRENRDNLKTSKRKPKEEQRNNLITNMRKPEGEQRQFDYE